MNSNFPWIAPIWFEAYNRLISEIKEVVKYRNLYKSTLGLVDGSVELPLFINQKFAEKYAKDAITVRNVLCNIAHVLYPNEFNSDPFINDIARPDLLPHGDSYSILEQNISAGVSGYGEMRLWEEYFSSHPVIGQFIEKTHPSDLLFDCYAQWVKNKFGKSCCIGVLDLIEKRNIDTPNTTALTLVKQLRLRGINAIWCSEYGLEVKPSGVYLGNTKLDVIWSHLNPNDFFRDIELTKKLVVCAKNNIVHLLNGPSATLMLDKSLLARVFDSEIEHLISKKDLEIIKKHLPWSIKVENTETEFEGATILKVNLLKENKDLFVLKRIDSYAAMHVELGIEHSQESWNMFVNKALAENNWIAQLYVASSLINFPFLLNENLEHHPVQILCSPYIVGSNSAGFLGFSRRFVERKGIKMVSFSVFPVYVVDPL
jgi:hypothetical protein